MAKFIKDYEIEMNVGGYVVYDSGALYAKDGEVDLSSHTAYMLDDAINKVVKEIGRHLYFKGYIQYKADVKRWVLGIFYDMDQQVMFMFERIQDILPTIKVARSLCDGRSSREFIEVMKGLMSNSGMLKN